MKIYYDCELTNKECQELTEKFKEIITERLESKACKNRGKLWEFSMSDGSIFIDDDTHIMSGDPSLGNTQHPEMYFQVNDMVKEIKNFIYEIAPKYRANIEVRQSGGLAKYYTFVRA